MTAAWKQKKFERLAQKDVVEDLKNQVAELNKKLESQKRVLAMLQSDVASTAKQRDEYGLYARRYNKLRNEEVMIATPDGFKLMTGEELDIHCGQLEEKTWWGQPLQRMVYTVSADEALDSWNYAKQIQQSLLYGTSTLRKMMDDGLNTGSESKETDQENP